MVVTKAAQGKKALFWLTEGTVCHKQGLGTIATELEAAGHLEFIFGEQSR